MATTRTVRQLIYGALRLCNIIEAGETPEAHITTNALQVLQDLIAEHAGSFFVPSIVHEYLTLVIGQSSYTIGENGSPDKDTQRPESIVGAFVRDSGNYDHPVSIITEGQYRPIIDKTTSGRPDRIWYNPTSPNGTVYVYPVPDAAESLYIDSIKTLSEPASLTQNLLDTVEIPRNYHGPLKWMLAVDLSPEFGRDPSSIMISRAAAGRNRIIALNAARSVKPASLEIGATNAVRQQQGNILSF